MKRIISFFMALIMSFMLFGCKENKTPATPEAQDPYIEKIKQEGVFKVGVVLDSQMPMTFAGEDFSVIGFDAELAEKIKNEIFGGEVRLQFEPVTSDNKAEFFKNGKANIILDRSVPDENSGFIYSKSYITDKLVLVGKKEYTKEALADLKIGVLNRGGGVEFLKKNNINSITTFTEYEDMTGALLNEMVDALVMSELSYKYFAKNGFGDTFMTDIGASEVSFAVCMPDEAGALKEEVDKALLSLSEDKSLDKMAAKWFGSTRCLVR